MNLSLVHPELQAFAKMIPQLSYSSKILWIFRLAMKLQRGKKSTEDVLIETRFIPNKDKSAQIRLRIYRPKATSASAPCMLWLHGGGYIVGRPEISEAFYLQVVRELGIVIVAPAYRKAPEHPFPAPLDDCYTCLRWVVAEANQLGIDSQRLAIGGESAGGGLAAGLVQMVHDRNEFKLAFQMLVYPMIDSESAIRSDIADKEYLVWTQASNRFGWESYLGENYGKAELPAYAVPACREDLSGLPPAWIGVGTLDLFHDEDVLYAQKLKASGVDCELELVQGAFHGFDIMTTEAKVVQDFRQSQINALKKYLL